MSKGNPSIGYSILAQVLDDTRHRIVLTTNFDNLIADALSVYTSTFPLVCGHESLAAFAQVRPSRPLVAKIHRDVLLAPKNDTEGTGQLAPQWTEVLPKILEDNALIVIGYGGNDGGLMGFLEKLDSGAIKDRIYWCYHLEGGLPNDRIRRLVSKHSGKLISVLGFDDFMLELGQRLEYPLLAQHIVDRAKERAADYREQFEACQKRIAQPLDNADAEKAAQPVREAIAETVQREEGWWAWGLKARAETDPDKAEAIYRQGLEQFPDSHELTCGFALFLHEVRKDYDEAERLYRRALELDPDRAIATGNFAGFLWQVRKDYDEAERLSCRAIKLDPADADYTGNFGGFLVARKRFNEAEPTLARAWALNQAQSNQLFPGLL